MLRKLCLWVAICNSLAAVATAEPPGGDKNSENVPHPLAMAGRIDQLLSQERGNVPLAPLADDATFLRRVSLDLTGRLPRVPQVRAYLADSSPAKHLDLIDELLKSPSYATHQSRIWRQVLFPSQSDARQVFFQTSFEAWLRKGFVRNRPYNEVVEDLLTTTGRLQGDNAVAYYSALKSPENLAANTARAVLGVQIQCAQCHDHPYDDWTQEDFWRFAAFFGRIGSNSQARFLNQVEDQSTGEVHLPGSDVPLKPQALRGSPWEDIEGKTRRQMLADWVTANDNPYFARATVNRVWSLMFGRPLASPVDDLSPQHLPTHPKVLDELATYFQDTGYDLKALYRTLALTKAYRLSSASPDAVAGEESLAAYARMPVRPLTGNQLYDAISDSVLTPAEPATTANAYRRTTRQAFVTKFSSGRVAGLEYEGGIPQALTLMNGQLISEATNVNSRLLASLRAPFFNNESRLEVLYMATLSRRPNSSEEQRLLNRMETAKSDEQREQVLSNVLWALLNSAEFNLNR